MSPARRATAPDGTEIAYRLSGSGPVMLLVHGGIASGLDWVFVSRLLRDRFTVVTMDRRGRGASGDADAYDLALEAADVLAVLDAAGGEGHLVAHSFGAIVAMEASARTDRLRSLVLYEPPISIHAHRMAEGRRLVAAVEAGDLDGATEIFLGLAGATASDIARLRESPVWENLMAAAPTLPRELMALVDWERPRTAPGVPVLLITGAETDAPNYLDGLDDLAAVLGAERVEIPGQRHLGHVLAADVFAGIVGRFCADVDAGDPGGAGSGRQSANMAP